MPPFSLTPGLREEEKPVGVRVPVSLRVLVRRHQGGGRCRRGTQTTQGGGEGGLISMFSGLGPLPPSADRHPVVPPGIHPMDAFAACRGPLGLLWRRFWRLLW